VDEEICDPPQDFGAPRQILALQHALELIYQIFLRIHG
jgi:hypothetical protein